MASGMAAISTTLLTLLKAGDHMLIQVRGRHENNVANTVLASSGSSSRR